MLQLIFFALFIVTLIVGAFSYFPSQKNHSIMKFVMENSGYRSTEVLNRKQIDQLNVTTDQGLVKIRGLMDDLAVEQNDFLDALKDQQQILKNSGQQVSDLMEEAQRAGKNGKDLLQLKSLASEIQDDQRLLVVQGQNLVALNNQILQNRKSFADQINLANINNGTSLSTLQQGYANIKDQTADIFDKVNQHSQEVRDQMSKMQDQLKNMPNSATNDAQQQSSKERIGQMLDREHEAMIKLADSEQRSRDMLQDDQEKIAESQDLLKDKLQQNQDAIDEERQRAEDQKWINQQREADQKQLMQDRQDLQNR